MQSSRFDIQSPASLHTPLPKMGKEQELQHTPPHPRLAHAGLQVKCLHLDVELLEIDRAAMRGPLAEMLGFAPLSDKTRKMLSPPA